MRKELKQFVLVALVLALPLAWLFRGALFEADQVMFSNDGPLGALHSRQARTFGHIWTDLNWLGKADPAWSASAVTCGFRAFLSLRALWLAVLVVLVVPLVWRGVGVSFWDRLLYGGVAAWGLCVFSGLVLVLIHFLTADPEPLGMAFGLLSGCFVVGMLFVPVPPAQPEK